MHALSRTHKVSSTWYTCTSPVFLEPLFVSCMRSPTRSVVSALCAYRSCMFNRVLHDHTRAPTHTDIVFVPLLFARPLFASCGAPGLFHRYLNSPVTFDLTGEILKASNTLLNFTSDNVIEGADSIPQDLIADARGLAFITFVKVSCTRSRMKHGLPRSVFCIQQNSD